jgi:pimeloyl-ACP methyl ester carboxylesterase
MTVAAADLDIEMLIAGSGDPLILLHGGTATANMSWTTAMPRLVADWYVVAPDTRGHGRTANPADELSYQQLADDVAALIDAMELDRPVIAGYSDGAQTALEFGLRHPGRAAALILGGAVSEPTARYVATLHEWGFIAPGEFDVDRIAAEFGEDFVDLRRAHVHASSDALWLRFLRQIAQLWLRPPVYSNEELVTITDPTLIITGDRDEVADLDQAAHLYHAIPNAELAIVPGASHGAAGRDIYLELVLDFLDRTRT